MDYLDNPARDRETQSSAEHQQIATGSEWQRHTLTFISGIGGTLARRLRNAGLTDIEELALAESNEVAKVPGVSLTRAERWITEATEKIRTRSAFAFRETGPIVRSSVKEWTATVDPYRLRRALELQVQRRGEAFTVNGGLEPHRVWGSMSCLRCDCADFAKGWECKHVLAVRIYCDDVRLLPLVAKLSATPTVSSLDLFYLWFGSRR